MSWSSPLEISGDPSESLAPSTSVDPSLQVSYAELSESSVEVVDVSESEELVSPESSEQSAESRLKVGVVVCFCLRVSHAGLSTSRVATAMKMPLSHRSMVKGVPSGMIPGSNVALAVAMS